VGGISFLTDRHVDQPMKNRSLLLKLLSAAIVFGAWEIAGRVPISYAFPTFLESMSALLAMTLDGSIFVAYAETLKPLVLGVAISAFIGLGAKFEWLLSPIFIVMQAAPLAALIPILVMVYGIGIVSKVFVVCIMAMPVIVLNTAGAVRNTPASIKDMARSFMASDRDVLVKIIVPAASPIIFSGLRLGVSAGFIGAILSELKITPTGVGDIISFSRSIADYPSMYAAIFSIILLAVIFLNLLEKLENYLFEGNNRGYVSD
jgi:NitT/TauT family transport system permease protein